MKITEEIIRQIVSHAKKDAPVEACGYLAAQTGIVVAAYALTNMDKSQEHFSFDPKEQFAAVRQARVKGLEISAVYHSHPASPARPSQEDIALANDPNLLYVIVSLAGGKEDIKAFRIRKQKIIAEPLEVINNG